MFYQAKNGTVPIDGTVIDYIAFGTGKRHLVMLPGLGEGLTTISGTAIPFAVMYRMFAKDFRIHVFGRRRVLPEHFSTRDIAEDVFMAMQHLGIEKANVVGISMGGMISQHLAALHPEAVEKLALVVTCARNNAVLNSSVTRWMKLAKAENHKELMLDNAMHMYTQNYLRKNMWMYKLLGNFSKPKSYNRFLTMAEACLSHDAYDSLETITASTLVIGGEKDLCLSGEASVEIAEKLPNAQLYMYADYGHALYEEAKDFNQRLLDFFVTP